MREFILEDYEERFAPPEDSVLRVAVSREIIFLEICKHEETHTSRTLTTLESIGVYRDDLVRALNAAMQADNDARQRYEEKHRSGQ